MASRPCLRGVKVARPRGKLNSGVALGRSRMNCATARCGFGDISSDPASVPSMVNKLQSAEPNFTFATRPVPRVTVFRPRFSNWGMTAWWWHPRWFQAYGRLSEDKPPGCLKPGSPAPRGRADRGLGSGGSMRRSASWCGLASCQPCVEAGTSATSVFLVASWPDLYRPHALDACPYKMANTPGLRSPRPTNPVGRILPGHRDAGVPLNRLTQLVVEAAAPWSMTPVVAA